MDAQKIHEYLKTGGRYLFHREGQELEFKEQFNLAGLGEYLRDFAAFANNRGGYIIFGVQNSPRIPVGINKKSLSQFEKIDPEKITGFILDIFSSNIEWEQRTVTARGKLFGVFYINQSNTKPIIAKADEGKDQIIKNGEIYYRYGGRTQKILYAELENLIQKRVDDNNKQWTDLMSKIATAGPQHAAILDTKRSVIEKGSSKILVLDESLAKKLKFVKAGKFVEKEGAETLKLVGDILPVEKVEVTKKIKEDLLKEYPLSAKELAAAIKERDSTISTTKIWNAIRENDIKNNTDYAAYNFRNKKQQDEYQASGKTPLGFPSIYKEEAVDFLVKILTSEKK